jgi:hypothetical protein
VRHWSKYLRERLEECLNKIKRSRFYSHNVIFFQPFKFSLEIEIFLTLLSLSAATFSRMTPSQMAFTNTAFINALSTLKHCSAECYTEAPFMLSILSLCYVILAGSMLKFSLQAIGWHSDVTCHNN